MPLNIRPIAIELEEGAFTFPGMVLIPNALTPRIITPGNIFEIQDDFGGVHTSFTDAGVLDMGDNSIIDIGFMDFNLVNGIAQAEGRAVWNDDDGTLNLGLKGGIVNLQVGQEQVLRGKNTIGSTIDDGMAVRISGASGSKPEFGLAEADVLATAGSIGLATEDILNNANGYVTTFGLVRDIDTTGTPVGEVWAAADRIFVSNTAGELTNVSPTSTERIIFIGIILRAHATEGVIWVSPINVSYLSELSGVTISSPADNELLAYDSGTGLWINQTPTEAGLDARYVEILGDTMTGPLIIDGGADEIQLIVQANATQTANLLELQESGGAAFFEVAGGGSINSVLAYTTTGTLDIDRLYEIKATVTGDNAGANRFPRALFAQIVSAGAVNFSNNSEIIGLEGQVVMNVAITVGNAVGLQGRLVPKNSSITKVGVGVRANILSTSDAEVTTAIVLDADLNLLTNTLTSTNTYLMRANVTTTIGSITTTNMYGLFIGDINVGGTTNHAILTNAGNVWFNFGGDADTDFIFSGDTDPNLLFLDGGEDAAAFGTATILSGVLLTVNGHIGITSQNEMRFYDNGNYVGFEAPALSANQIWVLPDADGIDGDVMFTDGAGNLNWGANASTRAFTFTSSSGGSGTIYAGGHYRFGATDNDFNPSITFGTANVAYGDHIFLVAAAGGSGGTDTVIRITGTSITDEGVRTAADTEDLTVDDAGAAGAYYETTKKWVGQVSIAKQSGPDILCNYGGTKYWDDNNEDFKVTGVDVTWLGGANDANPNLILRHHKATGWTYNAGSAPTPPTGIASMNTDYVTEIQVSNGEEGAWKRINLSVNVNGSGAEGLIIEVITTANKAFELGNFLMRVVPQ